MCARRSGNILFYFFCADSSTGSKDTELYKTDVSFFVSVKYRKINGEASVYIKYFDPDPTL